MVTMYVIIVRFFLLVSPWIETVWPYLQTVDEWSMHGHLWKSTKVFIMQR
jgi:gamma-tubulin complex component 5